jgi:hypothetical protein
MSLARRFGTYLDQYPALTQVKDVTAWRVAAHVIAPGSLTRLLPLYPGKSPCPQVCANRAGDRGHRGRNSGGLYHRLPLSSDLSDEELHLVVARNHHDRGVAVKIWCATTALGDQNGSQPGTGRSHRYCWACGSRRPDAGSPPVQNRRIGLLLPRTMILRRKVLP